MTDRRLVSADSDVHNSQGLGDMTGQPCGLILIHWNQSWNVKTMALKYVITKSGTPNIKVSWTLTLLYTLCSERTCSALLLLCYRFKEKEELYRKVISQFENNNQHLVRENISLRDTYCRLHTKLGCLTQQFTVLAVSTIIQWQCFIWQLVSVTSYIVWAVSWEHYTNKLCVGSQLRVLH
jgi:hypothetical protein